ncbi:phage tail length tape measure family protein [Burkholderia cenocepacia]|uniref:phage tail length tape measure family protein n=1 Tax=Burkholderia cenocepacia TaxID=95486 RepID=UPI002654E1BB|nr:phage tail length tape measure family protein [Burkholderia cenocepacia]MDN7456600.1 phage tail length tape measure family protein [Burkholderia cenocepacia]
MSDDNRVDVAITVTSDGAAQGAAKASDAIARAVNGIAQDLRELVAQSRATNAALTAGFTGVATSIEGMAGRMRSAVQQTTGVVDDYGNVVVATAARVQQANNQIVASQQHVGHASVAARREMLVLAHELMMGNYKRFAGSLMVLGEQMDWMGKIMTPTGAMIGAIAGALAVMASAALHGSMQMSHLRDDLILTGDYAGLTATRFITMGNEIAASTGTKITAARDALAAVAATGRFTGAALEPVTAAIAKIGQFSSAAAEEVVKSFEKMDDGVYKWAMEYNKSYHFANMQQLEHIRLLEEQGDKERAEAETAQLVIAKINETASQLGYLPGLWHDVRSAASSAWDAMMNWGRPVTIGDQINRLKAQIESGLADTTSVDPLGSGEGGIAPTGGDMVAERQRLRRMQQQRDQQEAAAGIRAQSEALQQKGAEAVRTLRSEWKGLGGDVKLANDEIARFRRTIDEAKAAAKDAGGPIPEDVQRMIARQPQIEAEIRKRYDSHDFKKSPGQVTVGHDYSFENAQTQARLNALREDLKAEQAELDRAYKQQQISLQGYYQQRLTITLRGMDAERDALKQQLDQTKALEARASTPAERLSMRTKEVEIEGRLTVMERQRAAAVTQSSQEMMAAINAETKGLEDLAAKRAASAATEAQRRATIVAEEEVRQGRMTQAQLLQMQQHFEEQKTELEVQALQRRLDTERSLTISQRQAIEDQIRAVRDQSETRQLQLSVQASDQETQYARQAADAIQQDFGRAFASFADRSQTATQAFGNFITSIDQMLTQLVAKKLFQQLFEMPFLGGDSASSGLMGILTSLLGGAGAGFSAAGAFGFGADIAGSAAAVASGAMESGAGGLSSLLGLASFDVGTPFVPNDMIAQIHRGEAIVPAHMNSPYAGGNVNVSNQFVLPGGTDLRTQSQIAAMAGSAISLAMRRNG